MELGYQRQNTFRNITEEIKKSSLLHTTSALLNLHMAPRTSLLDQNFQIKYQNHQNLKRQLQRAQRQEVSSDSFVSHSSATDSFYAKDL